MGDRIKILDTVRVNFYGKDSPLSGVSGAWRSRNNIDCLSLTTAWLIESYESGSDHGFYRTKEDEVMSEAYKTIVNKLNLLISVASVAIMDSNMDNLHNVELNSVGIRFSSEVP